MTILKILKYPEKSLLQPSRPVEVIDDKIDKKIIDLIEDMGETMFAAPGVGLAAPQIGINKRIIVYDIMAGIAQDPEEEHPKKEFKALINPEIINKTGSIVSENEGCLSVPDLTANVKRYEKVTIKAISSEGKKLEFNAEDINAIIMQHEIDHLDGVLFFEKISLLKKKMYKKRIAKKL
ncbi:MAG: peptide deformylase, partial [Desulfobacteraceae bacterium]|nr:peptide deformylase [Desulfobacteraceae bacterium]